MGMENAKGRKKTKPEDLINDEVNKEQNNESSTETTNNDTKDGVTVGTTETDNQGATGFENLDDPDVSGSTRPFTDEEINAKVREQQMNAQTQATQTNFFNNAQTPGQDIPGGGATVIKKGKFAGRTVESLNPEERKKYDESLRKSAEAKANKEQRSEAINRILRVIDTLPVDDVTRLQEFQDAVRPFTKVLFLVPVSTPKPGLTTKTNYTKVSDKLVPFDTNSEKYIKYTDNLRRKQNGEKIKDSERVKKQDVFKFETALTVNNPSMGLVAAGAVAFPSALYDFINIIKSQDLSKLEIPTQEQLQSPQVALVLPYDEFKWFVSTICGASISESKTMVETDPTLYNGSDLLPEIIIQHTTSAGADKKTTSTLVSNNRAGANNLLTKFNIIPSSIYTLVSMNNMDADTKRKYKESIETKLKAKFNNDTEQVSSTLDPRLAHLFDINGDAVSASFLAGSNPGTALTTALIDSTTKKSLIHQRVWGEYTKGEGGKIVAKENLIPQVLAYTAEPKKNSTTGEVVFKPVKKVLSRYGHTADRYNLEEIKAEYPAVIEAQKHGVDEVAIIKAVDSYQRQKTTTNAVAKAAKENKDVTRTNYTQEEVQKIEMFKTFGLNLNGDTDAAAAASSRALGSHVLAGLSAKMSAIPQAK